MKCERLFCYLTNEEIIGAKIASECPLIPVPNHGRLIDADAMFNGEHNLYCWEEIEDAPTVISADKKE